MAEPIDPLEDELASFRPQPISLELRERIGADLTRRPVRAWVSLAGLAAAAAACVAIAVAMWANRATPTHVNAPQERPTTNVHTPTRPTARFAASPPTVMDYRRAFAESSDAFDALLARPAGRESRGSVNASSSSVSDFMNSNNDNGDSL